MFLLFSIIEKNSKQAEIHLPLEGSTVPANVIRKILLLEAGWSISISPWFSQPDY